MVGNPADAEDLLQEAFPSAFSQDRKPSRGESAFSTWLHRDDGQCGFDAAAQEVPSRLLRFEETTEPDEESGGPRKDIGAPDLRLSGAVDRVNIERSVEKLPPGYRTVLRASRCPGLRAQRNCGPSWACSVGNSKSQLHKARTPPLRELLQERGPRSGKGQGNARVAKAEGGNSELSYKYSQFGVLQRTRLRGVCSNKKFLCEELPRGCSSRSEVPCSVRKSKRFWKTRGFSPLPEAVPRTCCVLQRVAANLIADFSAIISVAETLPAEVEPPNSRFGLRSGINLKPKASLGLVLR